MIILYLIKNSHRIYMYTYSDIIYTITTIETLFIIKNPFAYQQSQLFKVTNIPWN